ncbi:hypothetical protein D3H65_25730 [Paraflavitalea soli]|uniref:DUF4843 domain-containing protein n=1 Tax=Paraflavitalea soli TaxID=2315862 RepID=A0A3B7MUV8_9BACT|nr:hypothetical protein [Paraflavitalea soli]AXY77173.1 hypothetical protein D3H65_25730 [Paraflavitalea soli]
MIQKISCLLLIAGLGYLAAGCKKEKTTVPPQEAHFNYQTSGSYFVTQDANTVYKIPVGLTTTADQDRTVQFTISSPSGAAEGQQYTLDKKTVTIPAGKAVDTIYLKGKFNGYPTGRRDTLVFKITGGDVIAMPGFNEFKVFLQKYCPVNVNDFTGVYNAQDYYNNAPDGSPYTVALTPGTTTGNTGKITIEGLWHDDTPFNVNLNWDNPASFTTEVPAQSWFVDATYGQSTIRPNGKGTFSSCDNSFRIDYEVTVAAGSFGKYYTILTK